MTQFETFVVSGPDNTHVVGPFIPGGVVEVARNKHGWYWTAYGVTGAGGWFDLETFGPYRSRKAALRRAESYLYD